MWEGCVSEGTSQVRGAHVAVDGGSGREDCCKVRISVKGW